MFNWALYKFLKSKESKFGLKNSYLEDEDFRERITNLRKDKEDDRDFVYSKKKIVKVEKLPEWHNVKVDLPIRNQYNLGYCFSFAGIRALENEYKFNTNRYIEQSEMFLGYNTRVLNNTIPLDQGATIRDMLKTLAKHGSTVESVCPYVTSNFNQKPSWLAYWSAGLYKLKEYYRCLTIEDVKQALYGNHLVIFGLKLKDSFYKLNTNNYVYNGKGKDIGSHAMVVRSYDDSQKRLVVDNSWGGKWGLSGSFFLPYNVFLKDSFDWWVVNI